MTRSEVSSILASIKENDLPWGSVFSNKMVVMNWTNKTGWSHPILKPYGPIELPPSASIFHYGMEVFEGLKAYKAPDHSQVRLFRPQLNIARLNKSAKRIALPTVDEDQMLQILQAFVDCQRDWAPVATEGALYLRPCIIATEDRIGVRRSDAAMLFVIASPVGSFFATSGNGRFLDGIKLLANPRYVRAWKGGVGYCKTGGNYASSIGPAEEAKQMGFDQILWLSDEDRKLVSEVGMMNVFFVTQQDGSRKLITPRLDGTILDGVTRRSILELAKEMHIPAEERDISLDEVFEDVKAGKIVEIFGSGTAAVISPVHSITAGDDVVSVKSQEQEGDLSVVMREKLLEIQTSSANHPWMVPACGGEKLTPFREDNESQN